MVSTGNIMNTTRNCRVNSVVQENRKEWLISRDYGYRMGVTAKTFKYFLPGPAGAVQ